MLGEFGTTPDPPGRFRGRRPTRSGTSTAAGPTRRVTARIVLSRTQFREPSGGSQEHHGLPVQALPPLLDLVQRRTGRPIAVDAGDRRRDARQREVAAAQQIDETSILNVSRRVHTMSGVMPTRS